MSIDRNKIKISDLRKDYHSQSLAPEDMDKSPFIQFRSWLEDAVKKESAEPTAMVLSTVDESGRPSSRVVLLKDTEEERFIFFTNYLSRKGKELKKNPFAALLFFWPATERQVRIEGTVTEITREASAAYFHSRPRGSQISAFISPQSEPIPDRKFLEEKHIKAERDFEGKEIALPGFWGGYALIADRMEFWQGRSDRLHDRIIYLKNNSKWTKVRLAP